MRIFEPHAHMISRVTDDYERMALAGIEVIVEPSFWLGEPRKRLGTFLDYFDHIMNFERERAAKYGIRHYCLIALNPREANNKPLAAEVLKEIPSYLQNPGVLAVGEVGFDMITDAEEDAIRAQLDLARRHDLPVMVHTPHRDKLRGTQRTIKVLEEMKFDPTKVLLDHNTEETIELSHDFGAWCGHTVYPLTKLSPERAANIFERYGTERMMVNSSCDWGPSDPLSVPKTVAELKRRGWKTGDIRKIVWDNPIAFFGQSRPVAAPE